MTWGCILPIKYFIKDYSGRFFSSFSRECTSVIEQFPHITQQYVAEYNCLRIFSWHSLVGMILFTEEDSVFL